MTPNSKYGTFTKMAMDIQKSGMPPGSLAASSQQPAASRLPVLWHLGHHQASQEEPGDGQGQGQRSPGYTCRWCELPQVR